MTFKMTIDNLIRTGMYLNPNINIETVYEIIDARNDPITLEFCLKYNKSFDWIYVAEKLLNDQNKSIFSQSLYKGWSDDNVNLRFNESMIRLFLKLLETQP